MPARAFTVLCGLAAWGIACTSVAVAQTRHATSDNLSGYVHWIDLYDASNSRIDPTAENPKPYSPEKTCGRCHDFDLIAHGWHFNAVASEANHGRPGQPWIWSDDRTGTHLPLSYRGWLGTHNPDDLGLSRWQVAAKFGGFLPGGGPGAAESLATEHKENWRVEEVVDRTKVTGPLLVDCMMCHRNRGSGYSPFVWTEQIEDQNFAYAPTVALGLATLSGTTMKRIKDDFDPSAADAASKLPKMTYEAGKFRSDGKVFIDLIRKPESNSCYYCHTNVATDSVTGSRWLHDEDVHVRAGIACADCHRNGIDHHTVRGFEDEQHPAGSMVASLSCQGCHMAGSGDDEFSMPGRLGAPQPAHRGLPPLHFDKMSCTACHSGPLPQQTVPRQVNSIAHHLGGHVQRTGLEFPAIMGPVNLPLEAHGNSDESDSAAAHGAKYTPHRMMWPSFWGTISDGKVEVLNPEVVYDLIRRPLKVGRDGFTEDLAEVKLSLSLRTELIGAERARARPEEWTDEEKQKLGAAEKIERDKQVGERMAESLAAIEEKYAGKQAVFVSAGVGFVRDGEANIKALPQDQVGSVAEPYAWPIAHNVRPARQSLGVGGCTDCHSNDALFFTAEILPVGLLPEQEVAVIQVHTLQNADMLRLTSWASMFQGRSLFKIAGLIALGLTGVITLSACAINLSHYWRR